MLRNLLAWFRQASVEDQLIDAANSGDASYLPFVLEHTSNPSESIATLAQITAVNLGSYEPVPLLLDYLRSEQLRYRFAIVSVLQNIRDESSAYQILEEFRRIIQVEDNHRTRASASETYAALAARFGAIEHIHVVCELIMKRSLSWEIRENTLRGLFSELAPQDVYLVGQLFWGDLNESETASIIRQCFLLHERRSKNRELLLALASDHPATSVRNYARALLALRQGDDVPVYE